MYACVVKYHIVAFINKKNGSNDVAKQTPGYGTGRQIK